MKPTTSRSLILVAVAALLVGGCRSDGGIGRAGSARSRAWFVDTVVEHQHDDWAATKRNLHGVVDGFDEIWDDPLRELRATHQLYFDGEIQHR